MSKTLKNRDENVGPNVPAQMVPPVGQEPPQHQVTSGGSKLPDLQPELTYTLKAHLNRCKKQLIESGVDNFDTYTSKTVLTNTLVKCLEIYATAVDLIDEPWERIEECLIQTFGDKNKIKGEYARLIGGLNFHFRDGLNYCNKLRQLSRMAKAIEVPNREFLTDALARIPRHVLVKLVDETRRSSPGGDWMSLPVDTILDKLADIVLANNSIEAIIPYTPPAKRGRFNGHDPVMSMTESRSGDNPRDFARQFKHSVYIVLPCTDPRGIDVKHSGRKTFTNKLGKEFMLMGFNDKADWEAAEKNFQSLNVRFRVWENQPKPKNL
jgi:hypothetical protein